MISIPAPGPATNTSSARTRYEIKSNHNQNSSTENCRVDGIDSLIMLSSAYAYQSEMKYKLCSPKVKIVTHKLPVCMIINILNENTTTGKWTSDNKNKNNRGVHEWNLA